MSHSGAAVLQKTAHRTLAADARQLMLQPLVPTTMAVAPCYATLLQLSHSMPTLPMECAGHECAIVPPLLAGVIVTALAITPCKQMQHGCLPLAFTCNSFPVGKAYLNRSHPLLYENDL